MAAEWTLADAAAWVRAPRPDDDKYRRGVTGLRTGSERYPGAAVLGVSAAVRAGAGLVRYVGGAQATALVLAARPEAVPGEGRVHAWVIGSGTEAASRTADETAALRQLLAGDAPVIVDAGALDLAPGAAAPLLVTPHAAEHERLRAALGLGAVSAADTGHEGAAGHDDGRERAACETARALGGVVLLKGAVTIVATPGGWCRRVSAGTAWLATAGTGDVLAGALGALVAAACADRRADAHALTLEQLGPLAATGALLHGRAGGIATARTGGPVAALDVAEALPQAVGELLTGRPAPIVRPESTP